MNIESEYTKVVARDNRLITSLFELKPLEYKVMLYAIHKFQRTNKAYITMDEFANDILGKRPKDLKGQFIKVLESLTDQSIYIVHDGEKISTASKYKWLSHYTSVTRTGTKVLDGCEISIHPDLLDYLSNLKKDFTLIYLTEAFRLSTFYSMRLFELLIRFKGLGSCTFTVEQIRKYLGINEDEYVEYKAFKQKVLNKSLDAVNSLERVNVSIEELKKGRKVTHIQFNFSIMELDDVKEARIIEMLNMESDEKVTPIKVSNEFIEWLPKSVAIDKKCEEFFTLQFPDFRPEYIEHQHIIQRVFDKVCVIEEVNKIELKSYHTFKDALKKEFELAKNENYNPVTGLMLTPVEEDDAADTIVDINEIDYDVTSIIYELD